MQGTVEVSSAFFCVWYSLTVLLMTWMLA